MGGATVKRQSNSFSNFNLFGISHTHKDVYGISSKINQVRYFTEYESYTEKNVATIGNEIKKTLFPKEKAIGKK